MDKIAIYNLKKEEDSFINTYRIENLKKNIELNEKKINEMTPNDIYASAFLGATGPDLFYMPTIISKTYGAKLNYISDFMHYKNVGLFIKNLYEYSQKLKNENEKKHIVYLCKGFLSHMATDLIVHPFVNSLVGKYQEHIIKEVDLPGPSFVLDGEMCAHNVIEQAQDYYILSQLWKKIGLDGHNCILTNRAKYHKKILSKSIIDTIATTYGHSVKESDVQNYITYFSEDAGGSTFEEYPDNILSVKFYNKPFQYSYAIMHKSGGKDLIELLEKSSKLTHTMVQQMLNNQWDDITKPWNLDTGLYTECKIEKNKIKIHFKNYESVYEK